MPSTQRLRPLFLALTLTVLLAAACSPALPPLIRGPLREATQGGAATAPAPEPTAAVVATSAATPVVDATAPVTPTAAVEPAAVVTETRAVDPTPAITAITGQVSYRQRIALAPDAVVEVVLQDISRADAPAVTLGSQTIEANQTNGGQPPFPFVVEYNLSEIDPAGLYAMRATIKEGGNLTWTSTEIIPVITRGAATDQIEIVVQPVSGAQTKAEMGMIEGTVTYLQRIALPPNAVVEVILEDISRADAPAPVIARQIIETNGKQVPIEFALQYDPTALDPKARYNLRARITVDGKLIWTSTQINSVLTDDAPVNNVEIMVQPVNAS
jgi:uncharacterized lipoprotein YbaY